ncbi:MAG: hypothetical protein OQL06_09995 [Gammaproteobacteria bacterium]|nr:hypothetical protein [Gammaproteobacteria bacterium]
MMQQSTFLTCKYSAGTPANTFCPADYELEYVVGYLPDNASVEYDQAAAWDFWNTGFVVALSLFVTARALAIILRFIRSA